MKQNFRPEEWVSQAEAARIRGVSRQAIARLIRKGRFTPLAIGGHLILRRAEVEKYRAELPGRPTNERKTEIVKAMIESLSSQELRTLAVYLRSKVPKHALEHKWGITSELILDAIARAQDITQRGVRGVIAEAVFAADILPNIKHWKEIEIKGDHPFDFKIQREPDNREIRIQVKL